MPETIFYTTFSNNHFLPSRAKNGSESGLRSAVSYRFGFNGKENDNEVKGTGNSVDFGARIYDSRLGQFISIDPLYQSYPNQSPYCAFNGNPNLFADPSGKGGEITIDGNNIAIKGTLYVYKVGNVSDDDFRAAMGLQSGQNSRTISQTTTLSLPTYNDKGDYTGDINYNVSVQLDIVVITEDEAIKQMKTNTDPSMNYFSVQSAPVALTEDGLPRIGKGDINENSRQGVNRGWLSTQGILQNNTRPSAHIDNIILEEWWHTTAGKNYQGKNPYHNPNGDEKGVNESTRRGICPGIVSGDHTINATDIYAILRARGITQQRFLRDGNNKSTESIGETTTEAPKERL